MKKYILLSVLLIQNLVSISQNTIYVGNKSYPATSTWEFAELSLDLKARFKKLIQKCVNFGKHIFGFFSFYSFIQKSYFYLF